MLELPLFTTVISFRIVYSSSNQARGAASQPCHRTSPCVYHPLYPMGALFFRFDARTRLASGKVTNKLTVDFLESHVQTVHTAETGVFASTLVSPLFFRNLLLAGTHDGSIFRSQRVNSSQIHKVRFVVILVRRLRPSS